MKNLYKYAFLILIFTVSDLTKAEETPSNPIEEIKGDLGVGSPKDVTALSKIEAYDYIVEQAAFLELDPEVIKKSIRLPIPIRNVGALLTEATLGLSDLQHVVIEGKKGVGRFEFVQELVNQHKSKAFYKLNLRALKQNLESVAEVLQRLKELSGTEAVLVLENIEDFLPLQAMNEMTAGQLNNYPLIDVLPKIFALDFSFVLTTAEGQASKAVKTSGLSGREYTKIAIETPNKKATYNFLSSNKALVVQYIGAYPNQEALETAIDIAQQYYSLESLPSATLRVLRETVKYHLMSKEILIANLEQELALVSNELSSPNGRPSPIDFDIEFSTTSGDHENAARLEKRKSYLADQVHRLESQIAIQRKAHADFDSSRVNKSHIIDMVVERRKIERDLVEGDLSKRLQTFARILPQRLLGQAEAVNGILRQLRKHHFAGSGSRPFSIFSAGEPGSGKTYLAYLYAKYMMGGNGGSLKDLDNVVIFQGDSMQEAINVSTLTGASPNYVGYDDEMPLFKCIKNPRCVVLVDEVEKMHKNVIRAFLAALGQGYFVMSDGKKIDVSQATFFFTSNLKHNGIFGVKRLLELDGTKIDDVEFKVNDFLDSKGFPPEFIDRFKDGDGPTADHRIYDFKPHTQESLFQIAKIYLKSIAQNIFNKNNIAIYFEPDAVRKLFDRSGSSKSRSARPLEGELTGMVTELISPYIEDGSIAGASAVVVELDSEGVIQVSTLDEKQSITRLVHNTAELNGIRVEYDAEMSPEIANRYFRYDSSENRVLEASFEAELKKQIEAVLVLSEDEIRAVENFINSLIEELNLKAIQLRKSWLPSIAANFYDYTDHGSRVLDKEFTSSITTAISELRQSTNAQQITFAHLEGIVDALIENRVPSIPSYHIDFQIPDSFLEAPQITLTAFSAEENLLRRQENEKNTANKIAENSAARKAQWDAIKENGLDLKVATAAVELEQAQQALNSYGEHHHILLKGLKVQLAELQDELKAISDIPANKEARVNLQTLIANTESAIESMSTDAEYLQLLEKAKKAKENLLAHETALDVVKEQLRPFNPTIEGESDATRLKRQGKLLDGLFEGLPTRKNCEGFLDPSTTKQKP